MNWPLLLIKVTLLFLAAIGAAALLRRSAASTRHLIWSGLFASVVALPLLSAALPRIDIPVPATWQIAVPSTGQTGAAPAALAVSVGSAGAVDRQAPPNALGPAVDISRGVEDAPIRPSASRVLLTIWLTGALTALGALILSLVRLGRFARTAAVVTDPAWQSAAASIAARLRLQVPVRIVDSPDVHAPMAGGCWQPTVFLPAAARDWTTEQRDVVLTHELVHLAGRDPLRHALARVAVALYWFHPLAWIAAARASAAREAACDEAVIATGVRRSTYARILLDLSERATRSPLTNGALPIVQRSHLERRLMTILDGHPRPAGRSLSFLTTGAIVLLLSIAAAQPRNSRTTATTGVVGATSAHTQAVARAPRVLTPVVELVVAPAQASAPACRANGVWMSDVRTDGSNSRVEQVRMEDMIGGVRICVIADGVSAPVGSRMSLLVNQASHVLIESQSGSTVYAMEITRQAGGETRTTWRVNDVERPADAAADAWRVGMMAVIDTTWEISSLGGLVSTLQGEISTIQGQRSTLEGEISTLHGEVSTMQGRIATLRGEESTLRGRISSIQGQLSTLQGAVATERGAISSLQGARFAMDSDAGRAQIAAATAGHEQNILRLQTDIRQFNVDAKVAEVQREIADLNTQTKVAQVERQLQVFDLAGKVAAVEKRIRDLNVEGRIAVIERRIRDLDADRRISELETRRTRDLEKLRTAIAAIK
jgi:beta-lactamase regulating signal transducer with metallopeptidase domain/predicted  nucleic acid-binding Zn-ribbon protein